MKLFNKFRLFKIKFDNFVRLNQCGLRTQNRNTGHLPPLLEAVHSCPTAVSAWNHINMWRFDKEGELGHCEFGKIWELEGDPVF